MKLLMVTQKIDADDDILGVYHEWAREIAGSFEKLSVICLYRGRIDLPEDIRIFSLGKELKQSRFFYSKNFYKYIWSLRNDYDAVFVHMNPIYVVLGFLLWRMMGKKIFMWYAHPGRNMLVRLACMLSDKVITSVPEAFYARTKKILAIGQGIDTEKFKAPSSKLQVPNSILYLGRISSAKRVDVLLGAVRLLKSEGINLPVSIVGDPSDAYGGKEYYERMRAFVASNDLSDTVSFEGSVPNYRTPDIYNKYGIFVNLSPTGYFDKTVLEAMACECVVIASNDAYRSIFPRDRHDLLLFKQGDAKDLARKIKKVAELSSSDKKTISKKLREIVAQEHSLFTLGERLKHAFLS